jgi:hypothetical protein
MASTPYIVADPAKLQVANLPPAEKIALRELFKGNRALGESKLMEGGNFVARFGTRRVLWRRDAKGRPVILSVLDRSYATGF